MSAAPPLRRARTGLARLVGATGLAAALLRGAARPSIRILVYHRVSDDPATFRPCVGAANFEAHVLWLKRRFPVWRLQDIVAALRAGSALPEIVFALTFDDGYRDVATAAYPILRKHDVPASVYLVADAVDAGRTLWTDRVARMLSASGRAAVTVRVGEESVFLRLSTLSERQRSAETLWRRMKTMDSAGRAACLDVLAAALEVRAADFERTEEMLTWADVAGMEERLMEVGSHSLSHPMLANEPRAVVEREIADSKALIAQRTGREVRGFTYPGDSRAPWMTEVVERAGYAYACYVGGEANPGGACRLLELRRIHVEDWPVSAFAAEISPYGDLVRRTRAGRTSGRGAATS